MLKRAVLLLALTVMLLTTSALSFAYTPAAPAPLQYVASGDRSCTTNVWHSHSYAKIRIGWHTSSDTVTANVVDTFRVAQISLSKPSRSGDKARVNYSMYYRFHATEALKYASGIARCSDSG